ncbi:AVPR2 isoform 2 [Pan troglodytes]|uniref:Arginine vasopressin receptor 2 n=2 Tax=Homininae TaxID=207598 RepID=F8WET1_HUMAN|nr:AVPR2 isoform 2 [Pan troglodytes]
MLMASTTSACPSSSSSPSATWKVAAGSLTAGPALRSPGAVAPMSPGLP